MTERTPETTKAERREFYPEIEPFMTGRLRVSELHEIYFEQSGNPDGTPVAFVHGGPGGGTEPKMRRYFDPAKYRIVLFDQRGCGKSTPHAELRENTTWDLVADMERLRAHLEIDRWVIFGGSWGSTLGLAYAQAHPSHVRALVLRGIFLCRPQEIAWFYQRGASAIFPDAWERYASAIPEAERGDFVSAYHRRLTSGEPRARQAAARAWSVWEASTSRLRVDHDLIARNAGDEFSLAFARIECHYFVNGAFLRTPTQLLDEVPKIRRIPGVIVQGRYDVVCPLESAWALHRAWPEADLQIIDDAGHSASEPGTVNALIQACDRFAGAV